MKQNGGFSVLSPTGEANGKREYSLYGQACSIGLRAVGRDYDGERKTKTHFR